MGQVFLQINAHGPYLALIIARIDDARPWGLSFPPKGWEHSA